MEVRQLLCTKYLLWYFCTITPHQQPTAEWKDFAMMAMISKACGPLRRPSFIPHNACPRLRLPIAESRIGGCCVVHVEFHPVLDHFFLPSYTRSITQQTTRTWTDILSVPLIILVKVCAAKQKIISLFPCLVTYKYFQLVTPWSQLTELLAF